MTDDKIIDTANNVAASLPDDADKQQEILAIVRACLSMEEHEYDEIHCAEEELEAALCKFDTMKEHSCLGSMVRELVELYEERVKKLQTKCAHLEQQAKLWAQEARTQKSSVDEIGAMVGCKNDWETISAVRAYLSGTREPFAVGNYYRLQNGGFIKLVAKKHIDERHETVEGEDGVHRYSNPLRADFGRATGSPHDFSDPLNLVPLYSSSQVLANTPLSLKLVEGDVLPPIGSTVEIHLNRQDAWVPHKVVGYYAWGDLNGDAHLHRVFVRVVDSKGYENSRLLKDVRVSAGNRKGER